MSGTNPLVDSLARRLDIVQAISPMIRVALTATRATQAEGVQAMIDMMAGCFSEWADAKPDRNPEEQARRLAWLRESFDKITQFCALAQQATDDADFSAKADLLFETLNKPVTH